MQMTKRIKQRFIRRISEIFEKLPEPEHIKEIYFDISITIEGEITLSFDNPVKRELIRLFKKRYISPAKISLINKN